MLKRPTVERISVVARDGVNLSLHYFKPDNAQITQPPLTVLHLHANSYNSMAYIQYASRLATAGISVFLLDTRGNGKSEGTMGTVDYVGQLEDDLYDVIFHLQCNYAATRLVLSGHSGGTATLLRYLDQYSDADLAGIVLLAPVLPTVLEASRFDLEGSVIGYWQKYFRRKPHFLPPPPETKDFLPKMNALRFQLCRIFPFMRDMPVLTFPGDPEAAAKTGRTLQFSYKLARSYVVSNYESIYRRLTKPVFLAIGEQDDATDPFLLHSIGAWHIHPDVLKSISVYPDTNHLNIARRAATPVADWLTAINPSTQRNTKAREAVVCG